MGLQKTIYDNHNPRNHTNNTCDCHLSLTNSEGDGWDAKHGGFIIAPGVLSIIDTSEEGDNGTRSRSRVDHHGLL